MSDKQEVALAHINDVLESKNYIETNADGVVTIGTNGEIAVAGMQRTKVASVTLSKQKAFDFYQSLKSMFEE